ncbi:hypothetical protein P691DRAFT_799958 [Macrolepiota fuliginosa MF-IS2]|uniref:Autophagy-related protein 14 n=1 Tax=Macrolepiota fuliginosa MF-IS2 TaxID=1400762 RepID=A0A9P5XT52_9AGAR|nr:hypothetical protein P691DRAFT_799958 [Macrolepiota fuliginosa MF-IS2]
MDVLFQRRIRHIDCVQICNFTPFPVRDTVTSALSQPVEPSQLNTLGHSSDDLDMLARRRTRKISSTSTATKSSGRQEDDETSLLLETRGRKFSHSRRSLTSGSLGPNASPPGMPRIPYGPPQAARRRGRTNSVASSMSGQAKPSSHFSQGVSVPVTGSSFSMILPDISQQGLEKVIDSRLIETFLAITVLPTPVTTPVKSPPKKRSPPASDSRKSTFVRRAQTASISSLPTGVSHMTKFSNGTAKLLPSKLKTSHSRSSSSPMYQVGEVPGSSSDVNARVPFDPVPDYFSQIHRPSISPTFPIDARPGHDFSPDSNTSSSQLKVQLWGRTKGVSAKVAGKQKQKSVRDLVVGVDSDWTVMEQWDFSLDDLLPLPQDVSSRAADLPSNTLLLTLKPPGKTYYLPSLQTPLTHPPSPTLGYSSDPEFLSKVNRDDHVGAPAGVSVVELPTESSTTSLNARNHNSSDGTNTPAKGLTRTAAYQQLFELVNLQSLIKDHESTLSDLIQKIDKHFDDDPVFPLRREVYERQYRLEALRIDSRIVTEETAARKKMLELRRQRLGERKQFLVSARILEETNSSDTADVTQGVAEQRDRLQELRSEFAPIRTDLLSTLASIYPIELYSPPDLLYTILDVPLPIPLTATDPAPPLFLPNHRNVNEDAIATALGYVAQLLQLLAAYLDKILIYPVTCVGSRSFIKDSISAMVGPRMFPLFSKGVDTYRFEYGVFLLNKDIEMLMVDRDLRALDMRHTLPNLKNFVLTVTHGEVAPVSRKPPPDSPALSMLGLEFPTQEGPSVDTGSGTPKAKKLDLELPDESSTPSASGSTTPTVAAADEKKSRPFLGLSFSDFLRGRYPSTSRASVKSVPGGLDSGQLQANVSGLSESGGPEAPEACGDHIEDDIKPTPGDLEQVPNRRHESGCEGNEGSISEHKAEEATISESASVHVH